MPPRKWRSLQEVHIFYSRDEVYIAAKKLVFFPCPLRGMISVHKYVIMHTLSAFGVLNFDIGSFQFVHHCGGRLVQLM